MTHTTDAEFEANRRAHAKRMALPVAERKRLYAAHRTGDWATIAEIMGEDVGTN